MSERTKKVSRRDALRMGAGLLGLGALAAVNLPETTPAAVAAPAAPQSAEKARGIEGLAKTYTLEKDLVRNIDHTTAFGVNYIEPGHRRLVQLVPDGRPGDEGRLGDAKLEDRGRLPYEANQVTVGGNNVAILGPNKNRVAFAQGTDQFVDVALPSGRTADKIQMNREGNGLIAQANGKRIFVGADRRVVSFDGGAARNISALSAAQTNGETVTYYGFEGSTLVRFEGNMQTKAETSTATALPFIADLKYHGETADGRLIVSGKATQDNNTESMWLVDPRNPNANHRRFTTSSGTITGADYSTETDTALMTTWNGSRAQSEEITKNQREETITRVLEADGSGYITMDKPSFAILLKAKAQGRDRLAAIVRASYHSVGQAWDADGDGDPDGFVRFVSARNTNGVYPAPTATATPPATPTKEPTPTQVAPTVTPNPYVTEFATRAIESTGQRTVGLISPSNATNETWASHAVIENDKLVLQITRALGNLNKPELAIAPGNANRMSVLTLTDAGNQQYYLKALMTDNAFANADEVMLGAIGAANYTNEVRDLIGRYSENGRFLTANINAVINGKRLDIPYFVNADRKALIGQGAGYDTRTPYHLEGSRYYAAYAFPTDGSLPQDAYLRLQVDLEGNSSTITSEPKVLEPRMPAGAFQGRPSQVVEHRKPDATGRWGMFDTKLSDGTKALMEVALENGGVRQMFYINPNLITSSQILRELVTDSKNTEWYARYAADNAPAQLLYLPRESAAGGQQKLIGTDGFSIGSMRIAEVDGRRFVIAQSDRGLVGKEVTAGPDVTPFERVPAKRA